MNSMNFSIVFNCLTYCLSIGLVFTIFNKGDLKKNLLVFTLLAFIEMSLGEYMQYFSIFLAVGISLFYFLKSLKDGKEIDVHSIFLGIVPVFLVLIITNTIAYVIILIFNPDFYNIFYSLSVGGLLLLICISLYHSISYLWDIEIDFSKSVEIFLILMVLICIVYQHITISDVVTKNVVLQLIFVGVVCLFIVFCYFLMKSEKLESKTENVNKQLYIEKMMIENELKCVSLLNQNNNIGVHSLYDIDSVINLLVERVKEMNQLVGNDNIEFDIAILPTMPKKLLLDIYNFFSFSIGFCFYDIHPVSKCKTFSMAVKRQSNNEFSFSIVYEGETGFSKSHFKNWLSFVEIADSIFLSEEEIVAIKSTTPYNSTDKITTYEQKLVIEWKEEI